MIYFVDEDKVQLEPYSIELSIRGFDVTFLTNADTAFTKLVSAPDIELIILDIMLPPAVTGTSRYTRANTHDFITTGLTLLKDLIDQTGPGIVNRVVIFSMASQDWLVEQVQKCAQENSIRFLRKRNYSDPYLFGEQIEELVKTSKKPG